MSAEEMIRQELFSWDAETHNQYLARYRQELECVVVSLTAAHHAWREFDNAVQGSEELAHISALIFGALSLHLKSTKLLVWGYLIPAGNTMRQVLEIICMALLSSKPDLGFLKRYASNRYSTDRAVRDIIKNHDKLSLSRDALVILNEARDFYHGYSHPTLRTISTLIEFKGGRTFIGASFDPGKQFAYDKEVSTRVQVARLLENMIQGIRHNLLS